jgi:cell wall-associated NlpC family hydrolase
MKKIILTLLLSLFFYLGYTQSSYDVDSVKEKNENLWSFMTDWLGTRYKFGGMTKSGIDCSGFTKMLYRYVYKVEIPRTAQLQYKASNAKKDKSDLEMGDLVFFRTKSSPTTWHVGVYLEDGYFIHSGSRRTGVTISNLESPSYTRSYFGNGRFSKDSI